MKKLSLCLLLCFSYSFAFAAHVLPVFSNSWYTDANYKEQDACSQNIYDYKNLMTGTDSTVADKLLPEKAEANCQWKKPFLAYKYKYSPIDFIGSHDDWQSIQSNTHAVLPESWERECIDSKGNIIDTETINLQPRYICPQGSRFSYSYLISMGCDTHPVTCAADVLGRDLDYPGVSWGGHVGLASDANFVLQVLNDKQVIHLGDTLDSFKKASPFWGEVYGLPNKPYINPTTAENILLAGALQAGYDPEYTSTATYQPGGHYTSYILSDQDLQWHKVQTYHRAIFRCDTFVDYCYLAGANLHITNTIVLPTATFNAFTKQRFIGSSIAIHKPQQPNNPLAYANVEVAFLANKLNIAQADASMKQFIASNIPVRHKVRLLWNLALIYQNNHPKLYFLLDSIGFLHSPEVALNMIAMYRHSTNIDTKLKLISSIIQGITFTEQPLSNSTVRNTVLQTHKFLLNELKQQKNPFILKQLIYLYPTIVMPDQSFKLISKKIKAIESKKFMINAKKYSYIPKAYADAIKLRISLMTIKSQEKYLKNLLIKNENDASFNKALCLVMRKYPIEKLNRSSKGLLENYFIKHKENLSAIKLIKNKISICNVKKILQNFSDS